MKKTNLVKYVAALCLSAACLLFTSADVKADYVYDSENGVSYYDTINITSKTAYNYANGGGDYTSVNLNNAGDRITNVKVNKKGLIAKKTREYVQERTSSEYDFETDKYNYTTTTTYGSAYISFYGTKKGTYKVSFDVIDSTGKVKCTKKITVKVDATVAAVSQPIKKITYAGKEFIDHYPYAKKTSGKLKVTLKSGYKLQKIEIGKRNSKGEWTWKTMKNNKTLKLAKSAKYSNDYSYAKYTYNTLFPETQIRVYVKNKKTKAVSIYSYSLYTLNKK